MRPKGIVTVDEQALARIFDGAEGVIAAYLFGSVLQGETDHFSDVDVAVLFDEGVSKEDRWKLEGELLDRLFRLVRQDKADVVDLQRAPLWFQRVVVTKGKVIYDADPAKQVAYEAEVFRQNVEEDEGRWCGMEEMRLGLETLDKNLERLEELAQLSRDEFMGDPRNIAPAERWLQTSIEALADISRHVIRRLRLHTPDEYWQIPHILSDGGYLPAENTPTYEAMVRFRNRLVHHYPDVSPDEVYRIVSQELDDIRRWRDQLIGILQTL